MDTPHSLIDETTLPEDTRARIKAELSPGERVLWAGRPVRETGPSEGGGCTGFFAAAAGVCWLCGVLGVAAGTRPEAPGAIGVIGAVALALAVLFTLALLGTFMEWLSQRRRRSGRLYALTDRRAIAWEPQWGTNGVAVVSYGLEEILRVWRVDYPDGVGDVVFRLRTGGPVGGSTAREQSFRGVPEPRRVEELARQLSERARAERPLRRRSRRAAERPEGV